MFLKKIARKLKLKFYEINNELSKVLSNYNLVGSSLVLLLMIFNFGFHNILLQQQQFVILIVSIFYLSSYIIKAALYVNFWDFFKKNKFLSIIISIIGVDLLNTFLTEPFISQSSNSRIIILLLIQFYYFFNSLGSILKSDSDLNQKPISPPILLIISFSSLIIVGTILLMMPEISSTGQSIGLKNALFTSVSASTVTGLTILETAVDFSLKGQFIILLLIQLGGVNIIAFATFFALFSRKGLGIEQQKMISENFNAQNLLSGKSLLIQVFIFSVIIELIGTLIIFSNYSFDYKMLFESIFHSISAFNNAGFIISEDFYHSLNLKWCFTILIFLGAVGFPSLSNLISNISKKRNWKELHLTTKISVLSSLILIFFGAIMLFFLEDNNLNSSSIFQKVTDAIFHSTSGRTAGFTSIDFGVLGSPILIIFVFLMFIGASPGSFGGGDKNKYFCFNNILFYGYNKREKKCRNLQQENIIKPFTQIIFNIIICFISDIYRMDYFINYRSKN